MALPTSFEVQQALTAPGALFELVEEPVGGNLLPVFRNRFRSLRDLAELGFSRGNESVHLVQGERRLGFGEVVSAANGVSAGLADAGVDAGDRVAVLAANCPEWVITFWGVVDMGAVVVGLNGWWQADELLYGLSDSGARVLVADQERFARIAGAVGALPDLETVFLIDGEPSAFSGCNVPVRAFSSLAASASASLPTTAIEEDDSAVILYTSGTTGRSKGAVSTHRSVLAYVQSTFYLTMASAMMWGHSDVIDGAPPVALVTVPMFHVSGCHSGIVLGMAGGLKLVLTEGRFDAGQALRLIEQEQVSIIATVPTMVARMVRHPDRHAVDLSSVRSVAYGGSPAGAALRDAVKETFPNVGMVRNAYGLTETSASVTVSSAPEMVDRPRSVGRPVPGVLVRIVGATGSDQPVGEPGEIWLRGAQVMPGYWRKPEETALAISGGWLRTGDIGSLDDEGYLFVTDRAKDVIIRGGENVYSVEIEDRLVQHPQVLDAAVIGVPHPVLGEEVKAVVQVEAGSSLTSDELRSWVGETLADFKVPTYVEFQEGPLARNPTGKLLKNLLRGEGTSFLAEVLGEVP